LFEVDGKTNNTSTNYAFYATGSSTDDVGEGFTSPLWSKQKIEIPIHVKQTSIITDVTGNIAINTSSSFRMAYYNFDKKVWDPIGQGLSNTSFTVGDVALTPLTGGNYTGAINTFTCGVAPSLLLESSDHVTGAQGTDASAFVVAGDVISTFGFPYGPKYHATSSQCLNMKNYINKPFVLEKAVLVMSAAFNIGQSFTFLTNSEVRSLSAINTVFLLNQRKRINLNYTKFVENIAPVPYDISYQLLLTAGAKNGSNFIATLPTSSRLTSEINNTGPLTYVDTIRDIICYNKILLFLQPHHLIRFETLFY